MAQRSPDVIDIPRSRLDEATSVLVAAFEPDPLIRALLEDAASPYLDCMTSLMRYACLVRFELGWPLIGVETDGELAGVLGVSMPGDDAWPDSLHETYAGFGRIAGPKAVEWMDAYSVLADSGRPSEAHHHVGVVGVRPDQQGKGIGRKLIDAVQAMAEAHPDSIGVALDTENPASRAFYEVCGYHLVEHHDFHGVDIWCMFRPNGT